MAFDAERLCLDYKLDMARRGSKHFRTGWVNIPCPFCAGNPGYHGGFNIRDGYYNCHRCGNHWIPKVISGVLHIPIRQAVEISNRYFSKEQFVDHFKEKQYAEKLLFPAGCKEMNPRHKSYLESRNFDADKLEVLWGLQGTPPYGPYRSRIIAPIQLDGQLVSYQGRDITGKQYTRYMACPEEEEVWHHKFTLYGIDNCKNVALGVEGITDVWRLGYGSVAFFGIEFTMPQVLMIKKKLKRFFILFDNDPQAQENADRLGILLTGFNIETIILQNDSSQDPADMKQDDADVLMKDIGISR